MLHTLFNGKSKPYVVNLGKEEIRKITWEDLNNIQFSKSLRTTMWECEIDWWQLNFGIDYPTPMVYNFGVEDPIVVVSSMTGNGYCLLTFKWYQKLRSDIVSNQPLLLHEE